MNGVCAKNQYSCSDDSKLTACEEGKIRCEDGICRSVCPAFHGCPTTSPFNCPDGFCAETIAGCAGHSSCPLKTPFRCADNSCVLDITECS
jgi:hypothetical protein